MESLLASVPEQFLRSIGSDEDVAIIFLRELWPTIVGNELARSTEPLALLDKKLEVRVPSLVWAKQLSGLKGMLIHSINGFWSLRLVERIEWEVDLKV
jgi:hypothetical protein